VPRAAPLAEPYMRPQTREKHEQCKLKSIFSAARKRLISFYNTNCARFIELYCGSLEAKLHRATHMSGARRSEKIFYLDFGFFSTPLAAVLSVKLLFSPSEKKKSDFTTSTRVSEAAELAVKSKSKSESESRGIGK
jgi:hypothetical protein